VNQQPTELVEPLWANTARALSEALAEGAVSCVEVVTAHLDRMDEVEPSHHALIWRRPGSEVLADARERDAQLLRSERKGWMHGLPHAVKDLADVAGLPTSWGVVPLDRAPVATADSLFVSRLRAAGAVFVGKTNTSELGLGSHSYNTVAPTTRNVFDANRSAGGSSGGAAVAVALGCVPVADGSDFMGSLRNPPGWNGVLGLRPTPGRVPDLEDDPFRVPNGVVGPLARTVGDLMALDATMRGPHVAVPYVRPGDRESAEPGWPRIGWLTDLVASMPFEAGVLDVCHAGLAEWSRRGAQVVEVRLPSSGAFTGIEVLWPTWLTVRHHDVGGGLARLLDASPELRVKPEARWEVDGYRTLTVEDVDRAADVRAGLLRSVLALLQRVDVLALPTAQVWPFDATWTWPREVAGRAMDTYHRWMEVTALATLAGLPVLVVPAGQGRDGLPMGVQLIGRPGGEQDLFTWARAAEHSGVFEVAPPDRR
jgi:amidase